MQGDILFINKNHVSAARNIYEKHLEEKPLKKYIITVTGETQTGKSEIAYLLARLLAADNVTAKVLNMDSYYRIPPKERQAWRRKHGIEAIGVQEYDWDKVNKTVEAFKNDQKATVPYVDVITKRVDELITDFNGIDVLILNGLYAIACKQSNLNVFIELDYRDSLREQQKSSNEVLDEWRMKELEQEHKIVQALKKDGHYFVDSDTSLEFYHL
jgi:uridine kinase